MIRCLIFIIILLSSSNAFSAECPFEGKSGYPVYYDSEFAKKLKSDVEELAIELRKINILTFKNRNDLPAHTAVALMEEVKETSEVMLIIKKLTQEIIVKAKCNENPDTLKQWVAIARNLSGISGYINDIERFRLIENNDQCFSCILITVGLSQTFDFIEARINNEAFIL